MMINNELSKSSLELIDITIPGRHGPGMRREMMPWLYELMPIGKLRHPEKALPSWYPGPVFGVLILLLRAWGLCMGDPRALGTPSPPRLHSE